MTALDVGRAADAALQKVEFDESAFRFGLNEDAMATKKLAEAIGLFTADAIRLDELIVQADGSV